MFPRVTSILVRKSASQCSKAACSSASDGGISRQAPETQSWCPLGPALVRQRWRCRRSCARGSSAGPSARGDVRCDRSDGGAYTFRRTAETYRPHRPSGRIPPGGRRAGHRRPRCGGPFRTAGVDPEEAARITRLAVMIVLAKQARSLSTTDCATIAPRGPTKLGISFRPLQAVALGLDPKAALETLLKYPFQLIRVAAYWNRLEPQAGSFDPLELDLQLTRRSARASSSSSALARSRHSVIPSASCLRIT